MGIKLTFAIPDYLVNVVRTRCIRIVVTATLIIGRNL